MQLVIRDGVVIATHDDSQQVFHKYPGCLVVRLSRPLAMPEGADVPGPLLDPRTDAEKAEAYKDLRRAEYPSVEDQLDMIYWDQTNGTTTWRDAITAVKQKYPKPDKSV